MTCVLGQGDALSVHIQSFSEPGGGGNQLLISLHLYQNINTNFSTGTNRSFHLYFIFFKSVRQCLFQDIIGKTDVEIFSGAGVKESQDFKREVMQRGVPAKREITFDTELFGSKTFLIHVEPVFSKSGETIGVNYMGMDVTDQVGSFRFLQYMWKWTFLMTVPFLY